jgi:hypothetical protein
MTIWIPKGTNPASKTMDIVSTMIQDFGVSQINNDTYNDNFNEYYNQHIRQNEAINLTFCSKNGKGINSGYLIDNANKHTYVTLLSLDTDPDDPDDFTVLAAIVFKWSPTAGSVKIQAFCGNQKLQSKGAGTKLLNFLKKTLTHMGINNIYLNPIRGAIPYYTSQQFVEAKTPKKKVYDTSSSETKSKTKSKTRSPRSPKSSSKSKTKTPKPPVKPNKIPTMTINLRAAKNWKSAKTKMSSIRALTRKTYGKKHEAKEKNVLLSKIDKIVDNLSTDQRDFAQYQDIIDIFDRNERRHLNEDEEDIVIKHLRSKYDIY